MSEDLVPSPGTGVEKPPRQQVVFSPEQTEEVINDLEQMLNLIQDYQRIIKMLFAPDPHTVETRILLSKYKMGAIESHPAFRVFLDGRDITDYPDSIPATAEEMTDPELEAGDSDD